MRAALRLPLALAGSALAHAAAAALLLPAYAPDPPPAQDARKSAMALDTLSVPRTQATPRQPETDDAAEAEAQGSSLAAEAVPRSRVEALRPEAEQGADLAATGESLAPARPDTAMTPPAPPPDQPLAEARATPDSLPAAAPEVQAATALSAPAETLADTAPRAETLASATAGTQALDELSASPDPLPELAPRAEALPGLAAPATALARLTAPPAATVRPAAARADTLPPAQPAIQPASPARPAAEPAAEARVTPAALPVTRPGDVAQTAAPQPPEAETASQPPLPETRGKAAVAWQFGDRVVTDPKSLATIAAFVAPDTAENAEELRDDLAATLTGTDCARVSATFLPEDGVLELRGHVPDPELGAPLLDALRQQVGDGIPVRANLLHLPAPQCGALAGMARTGLPQSTDQFTNRLLIGATAHAREYSYSEGQRLQFDLTAPDYDAYVYVDYFAADGSVIHLVPNRTIPLEEQAAKSTVPVGQDRGDRPGLRITIGPPYGQEIAVAFAASEPLYEGLRPISEPAEPYLEFLKDRIAEARAESPGFKGEWVYFFITTSPAAR
ncbi:MAG: DUF4384 domain-containing protein [Pseudooceanicola sp.]